MPKKLPLLIDHCWECPYHRLFFQSHRVRVSEVDYEAVVRCRLAYFSETTNPKIASVPHISDVDALSTPGAIKEAASGTPDWCPLSDYERH